MNAVPCLVDIAKLPSFKRKDIVMNHKTLKWLAFLFLTLLSASLACGIEDLPAFRATEQVDPNLGFCGDDLVLSNEYSIICTEQDDKILNTFTGSYFNNSDNYIESVEYSIRFRKYGTFDDEYCHFLVGSNIAPLSTKMTSCSFSSDQCFQDATPLVFSDECDYDINKTLGFEIVELPEENQPDEEQVEEPIEELDDQPTIEEIFNVVQPDINKIRMEWPNILKQHPCEFDVAMQAMNDWVNANIQQWIAGQIQLVGPDQSWETVEEYTQWLIANALDENREKIVYYFDGYLDMENAPTKACQSCAPPIYKTWIRFNVDLETCSIIGAIFGRGVGDGVKTACEGIENECNVFSDLTLEGKFSGSADPSGNLTLEPVNINTKWQATFEGCRNRADGPDSGTGTGIINLIGTINWETLLSEGKGEISGGSCAASGTWKITGSLYPW